MSKNKAPSSTVVGVPPKTEQQVPASAEEDARHGIALLLCQLLRSVPLSSDMEAVERRQLENAAMGLLYAVDPQDGLETMAAIQLAALNLASLDSLGRAANCGSESRARDLNLRYGIKSATAFTDLMKAIDGRRGSGLNKVSVGSVKVASGGQAIVGNIENGKKRAFDTPDEQHGPNTVQGGAAIGAKTKIKSAA